MGRKKRPILPREAKTVEHETPSEIFDPLNEEFGFTLDAAASSKNKKCKKYFNKKKDGLKQSWKGHTVWINPPYDVKSLNAFVDKAFSESIKWKITVVMLMPCKTDQKWWHKIWDAYCNENRVDMEIRWIKGRVKFKGHDHSAAFPNVVVVLKDNKLY